MAFEDCSIGVKASGKSVIFMKVEVETDGNIEVLQGFLSNDGMFLNVPCGSTSSVKWYVKGKEGSKYQLKVTTSNGSGDVTTEKTLKSSSLDYGSYTFIN